MIITKPTNKKTWWPWTYTHASNPAAYNTPKCCFAQP